MKTSGYRVRYDEGQPVQAIDLSAEQAYLIALEQRHNAMIHSHGLVSGLETRAGWISSVREHKPGVAVDANGNVLVLQEPWPLGVMKPVEDVKRIEYVDSWLIRCEEPQWNRRAGLQECSGDRFDRWRFFLRIMDVEVKGDSTPTAPMAGAVYLGRSTIGTLSAPLLPQIAEPAYAGLYAARVDGPRRDVLMLVGPETGRARDGFIVRLAAALNPAIAIDRLGVNRFHGNIQISGYRACAHVQVSEEEALTIEAVEPGAVGERMHLRVLPESGAGPKSVRLDFVSGGQKLAETLAIEQGADLRADIRAFKLKFGAKRLMLRLDRFGDLPAAATTAPATEEANTTAKTEGFFENEQEIAFRPCGGSLSLKTRPVPDGDLQVEPRGCLAPQQKEAREFGPIGLSFEAMEAAPKEEPALGFLSVKAGATEEPAEELRLDLGEKRDNDQTLRLAIGNSTGADFQNWLTVNGSSGVTIPLGKSISGENLPEILRVDGFLRRGPIKADPSDPLFTKLLIYAYVEGLQRSVQESNQFQMAMSELPQIIETGKKWSYKLTITNNSPKDATADGLLEKQSSQDQPPKPSPPFLNIATALSMRSGESKSYIVDHPNNTPDGTWTVDVRLFGKVGNASWWASKQFPGIVVIPSPVIDLAGIPDSVPPGSPWEMEFSIANPSVKIISLATLRIDNTAPPNTGLPADVGAGGSRRLGPFAQNGMFGSRTFTIKFDFTWPGGVVSEISATKTVEVRPDLVSVFLIPTAQISPGGAFDFQVKLENRSNDDVVLTSVEHQLSADNNQFAPTGRTPAPWAGSGRIAPNQSKTIQVNGTQVPQAAGAPFTATIELFVEYTRGNSAYGFKPNRFTHDFDVT